jgi:3-deoxy-7-phosphoheptulonate synthase
VIIIMRRTAAQADVEHVLDRIKELGFGVHLSQGEERTIIGAIGDERHKMQLDALKSCAGVERIVPILQPFKLVSREMHPEPTVIQIGDVAIGGSGIVMIAGPCAVENHDQMMDAAKSVKAAGAVLLRGGAFKPRTSPYSFQGLGEDGLKLLADARAETGLGIVTEVLAARDLDLVCRYADVLQIDSCNMANVELLKAVGSVDRPVMLKRGQCATVKELLMSAEYIAAQGNQKIILCERGIRTFEEMTRNTLDLSAVPLLKRLSHLPVIVDPSHGTGVRDLVLPMSKAAIMAGADGLMVEVHPEPERALSDGPQSLRPEDFERLIGAVAKCAALEDRHLQELPA